MATRTEVILMCDLCPSEDGIETHDLTVDNRLVQVDTCQACWKALSEALSPVFEHGRGRRRPRKRRVSSKSA